MDGMEILIAFFGLYSSLYRIPRDKDSLSPSFSHTHVFQVFISLVSNLFYYSGRKIYPPYRSKSQSPAPQ